MWALALLALLLIACNFAFVHSSGWSRWGWQLLSFGGLFAIYRLAGLNTSDIGLSRLKFGSGFKYGLVAAAIIAAIFLVVFLISQNVFKDSRYHQGWLAALSTGLFIVPLKTVLFEELAFRGIMPALLKNFNTDLWFVIIISSLAFGLWHIASAPKDSFLGANHSNLLILGTVFIATALGGAILYYLRYKSGSLVAPIIAHWFINGFAIILAALSWK